MDSNLQSYIEILIENKKESSKQIYRGVIEKYQAWLAPISALEATQKDAWRYVAYLKTQKGLKSKYCNSDNLSYASIKKYLNILGSFYKVLIEFKEIDCNPFDSDELRKIGRIKQVKRLYNPIPYDKVQSIINNTTSERDKALISALFFGGLRSTEACKLRIQDLHVDNYGYGFLWLKDTKNGDSVQHPLPVECFNLLKEFADKRMQEGAGPEDPIFLNRINKQLDKDGARRIVQKACESVGLRGFTTHCIRVTAISKLLDDGLTPQQVQVFSRHKDIEMVMHYKRTTTAIKDHPALKLKY